MKYREVHAVLFNKTLLSDQRVKYVEDGDGVQMPMELFDKSEKVDGFTIPVSDVRVEWLAQLPITELVKIGGDAAQWQRIKNVLE